MARKLKLSSIGPIPPTVDSGMSTGQIVDFMLDYWQNKFNHVLPDKPDLILVPEACDRPNGLSLEKLNAYYAARGDKFRQFFARVASQNNCYLTYSSSRLLDDGTCRNSTLLYDRRGQLATTYSKNHVVIEETTHHGVLCGKSAVTTQCDFGTVGFAICFDLNFPQLRQQYEKLRPDLILFCSMYHGGLMQPYWAYVCRSYFASAVASLPSQVYNPLGKLVAQNTNYFDFVTVDLNLDFCVAHLDYNLAKLAALKKKYARNVTIDDPGLLGSILITSNDENISAKQMVAEFEIELLDDYFARALRHRDANLEP
jgi:predicted amidohydrolase